MGKQFTKKHPSKKAEKPISKAGVMMYEDTPDGRTLLVAYNEGRFAKNGRYLVLPKGSVDVGESVMRAGLRECGEETGFHLISQPEKNIEGYFTQAQVQALERGETLEHITNPRFPGFEIIKFDPHEFTHTYHARSGDTHSMVMFGIAVNGLDMIAPKLKNSEGKPTKDFLDKNPDIPRFPEFLSWLKQGFIPADGDLQRVNLFASAEWFAAKENAIMPKGIEAASEAKEDADKSKPDWEQTRKNWQTFCKKMEKEGDYKILRQAFHAIKQRMIDKGFVQGDNAPLKFDEKDCPLFWYTEGGLIGYARPILAQTFTDMANNHDYARAFGGEGTNHTDLRLGQKRALGQVAAYKDFIPRELWNDARRDAGIKRKEVTHIMRVASRSSEAGESKPSQARA